MTRFDLTPSFILGADTNPCVCDAFPHGVPCDRCLADRKAGDWSDWFLTRSGLESADETFVSRCYSRATGHTLLMWRIVDGEQVELAEVTEDRASDLEAYGVPADLLRALLA